VKLLITSIASLLFASSSIAADMDFRGPEKMSASETAAIRKIENSHPGLLFYKEYKTNYFIFFLDGFECPIWVNSKATDKEVTDAMVTAYWAYEYAKQSLSESETKK
jgi:hypothetical protein